LWFCDMVINSMWREMRVDGQLRFVGYLLCVILVLEAATVEQTSAAESVAADGEELKSAAAAEQRVRRHAYSVTNDLMTLTKMLRDESERRRMQSAEAFFNSLHKRHQLPKHSSQNDETLNYRPSRWI